MVEHRHTRFVSSITHALRVLQSSMPKTEITSEVLEVLARAASCEWATYWQVDSSQQCPSEALLVEIEHLGIQLGTLLEAAHQQNTATGR